MTTDATPDSALGERAYRELLHRLITLEIRPGDVLAEESLAADLGVGVTPVRRAIQRLAQEGLVRVYPRRATIAELVRISDIQHLWEIRVPLEETAAHYAAQRASAAHRRELQRLANELEDPPTEAGAVLELHRRVHEAIADASMNPFIADRMAKLLNLTLRCWHVLHESGSLTDHDLRPHHLPLLQAIIDGDAQAAVACSRRHVEHSIPADLSYRQGTSAPVNGPGEWVGEWAGGLGEHPVASSGRRAP
ncbi:MAG TPA: GntR family transcriptional regulator [Nocardioidaceae bacterium]|nr:GntR family transcriptional regulator [Nocardioidaceae bacterium]